MVGQTHALILLLYPSLSKQYIGVSLNQAYARNEGYDLIMNAGRQDAYAAAHRQHLLGSSQGSNRMKSSSTETNYIACLTIILDSQKIITWSEPQHLRCYIIATASS